MKVAVVGLAPSSHDAAPWHDPEWEIWGLPWDGYYHACTRLFEMHDISLLDDEHRPRNYLERLEGLETPVYMQTDEYGVAYPLEEVIKSIGRDYFNSSISYMIALAIHEGAEEISIYGCDLSDDEEYAYQRPNVAWLIGLAEGRGITVHVHPASTLMQFNSSGIKFGQNEIEYKTRYGYL